MNIERSLKASDEDQSTHHMGCATGSFGVRFHIMLSYGLPSPLASKLLPIAYSQPMSESFNLRRKDSLTSGTEPVTQRITSPRATAELTSPPPTYVRRVDRRKNALPDQPTDRASYGLALAHVKQ